MSESSKKNPADNLKEAFQKLSNEVKQLGMVLGVKEGEQGQVSQPEPPKNEFAKDMTQEEKQKQRAAKAAEKKARAEAAAAKKAGGAAAPQQNQQKAKEPAPKKEQVAKPAKEQNQPKSQQQQQSAKPKEEKIPKSALKSTKNQSNGAPNREVQFDLQSNTTNVLRTSESEEVVVTPDPPIVPLEDAQSLANIHPAFLTLYSRCDKELIFDLEQLCQEFIRSFKLFLSGFASHSEPSTFSKEFDQAIRPQLTYLTHGGRWPLPYALGNIVRQLKREVLKLDSTSPISQQIEDIHQWLEDAESVNFEDAYRGIFASIEPKLAKTKCVLTYDWCPVVNHVLLESVEKRPDLRVCFVDPELNGRAVKHVNSFVDKGYKCQYTDLKSVGYAIKQCSMIVLGCSAILSNGCVATTKGSIQIALTAKAYNVPVLVVSQYFKFVDKVQSYTRMALLGRENIELLPSTLVTAIVTDIRILAPTAAPAVLKAKALDLD
ncbi:unnamed protein product [Caenorhabditis angaria]|uniref:Translation initiation factor eIF2B subunit delta n=1 Tax=Caenorhabditis angaria TaxID=860376 RepID=A0A9P1N9G8_9PELO|nr:unnamed protein product [Caenorhabditis angaria]